MGLCALAQYVPHLKNSKLGTGQHGNGNAAARHGAKHARHRRLRQDNHIHFRCQLQKRFRHDVIVCFDVTGDDGIEGVRSQHLNKLNGASGICRLFAKQRERRP